jgi:hypothetical protein
MWGSRFSPGEGSESVLVFAARVLESAAAGLVPAAAGVAVETVLSALVVDPAGVDPAGCDPAGCADPAGGVVDVDVVEVAVGVAGGVVAGGFVACGAALGADWAGVEAGVCWE